MKFAGIVAAFAMAGSAFAAAIPRTVVLETVTGLTTLSVALNELDHFVKTVQPMVCNADTKNEITELANGMSFTHTHTHTHTHTKDAKGRI